MAGQAALLASSNARAVAPVACLSSSFTKPADASRLCRVATSRPGKRLSNAGNGRVIAAIEDPSPRNDGARRQAKLQVVASDISSARGIFAPPPFEPSSRVLRLGHLCAASPHDSPNNKMAEVKPDWTIIQLEEEVADLEEKVADVERGLADLKEENARFKEKMAHVKEEIAHVKAHRKKEFQEISSRMDKIEEAIYPFLEAKICVTAGELLKRAAGGAASKHFNHGQGRHFYGLSHDKLKLAWLAYTGQDLASDRMSLDLLKKDFQEIILARNRGLTGVHFHTVEELTSVQKLTWAVDHCLLAFERFSTLKTQYPKQWTVIKQFEAFKKLLPNEFRVRRS